MDQHEEKENEEVENRFQLESPDRRPKEEAAVEEPMEQREEYCDEATKNSIEPTGQLKEAVAAEECVSVDDEASPLFGVFAHPCSLLRYLFRACAGCWGLHGAFSDDDPKPAPAAPEAAATTENYSSSRGGGEEGGGEKANQQYFYMREVVARVWAVRRPRPPDRPREGNGGNGGIHH